MARPELNQAVAGQKNTASAYNENFDLMLDYIDTETTAAKDYVDSFMPSMLGQTGKILTTDGTDASWMTITGIIHYFGGNNPPDGWLTCDGSAVSRTTYANLFSVIGTNFGAGDSSTTFNLPNLIDRFPHGATSSGATVAAGLPNITGYIDNFDQETSASGAFTKSSPGSGWNPTGGSSSDRRRMNFSAANSSSIYKNSVTTVQPPALKLLPIIKY